eukprot:1158198-Pelagomonas_calceolata.AAC.12
MVIWHSLLQPGSGSSRHGMRTPANKLALQCLVNECLTATRLHQTLTLPFDMYVRRGHRNTFLTLDRTCLPECAATG